MAALPVPPVHLSVVRWLTRTVLTWLICRLRNPAGLLLQACMLVAGMPPPIYLLQPAFRFMLIPPLFRLVVDPTPRLVVPPASISVRTLEMAHGLEKLHPPPCLLETAIRPTMVLRCPDLSVVRTFLYPAGRSPIPMFNLPVRVLENLILKLVSPLLVLMKSNGGQAFLRLMPTMLVLPTPRSRLLVIVRFTRLVSSVRFSEFISRP